MRAKTLTASILLNHITGLIHRNHRPVYYSPSSHSALAEAELIYNDAHISYSVYVSFTLDVRSIASSYREQTGGACEFWRRTLGNDLEAKVGLLVWTTTPWTLSANMVSSVFVGIDGLQTHLHVSLGYRCQPDYEIFNSETYKFGQL